MLLVFSPILPPAALAQSKPAMRTGQDEASAASQLTPDLQQVARITGALPLMTQIEALQNEFKSGKFDNDPMAMVGQRQKLLYIRQKLIQVLETSNLEVNATRGRAEAEMASIHELQATVAEKRTRSLRRNTIINFVSGGITKIVGYSIALGGIDTPTNILEVVDGTVQCGLSGVTMKEFHGESELVKKMPELLVVLHQTNNDAGVYPRQIWLYLNEPASGGSGHSRRDELMSQWQARGIFERRDKAAKLQEGNLKHHITLARITNQLLDDRLAMISELRSMVSQMHLSLMRLSQICKNSYEEDPSFDWPLASQGGRIQTQ